MASTYTTGFGIEKIGSGEQADSWGTTTNHNADIIDRLASYKAVALSGTTHTLTVQEASPESGTENLQDGMYRVIKFTGALGANNTVTIAPNTSPAWFIIENATTDSGSGGPYSVVLSQGSGGNVTVQNGKNVIVYCDGAGAGAAVVDALADLQIGTLEVTGAAAIDGVTTHGGNVVSDTDSTDDLGTTTVRWANLFVDGITATDQITATGFTGTLDGTLGSGAAAAASVTTLTTSGVVSVDDTTDTSSGTTGSIHTDGGLGVAKKLYVGVSAASTTNTILVWNPDNSSATSHAQLQALSGGTSGGDAFTHYRVSGTTSWATGINNSVAGDPYEINPSTVLDASPVLSITTAGAATFSGAITTGGIVSVDDTTDSTSATTGSIHTDGGLGVAKDVFFGGDLTATNAAGPTVLNEAATATNPTLVPNRADPDTGVGWGTTNELTLVTAGAERVRIGAAGIVEIVKDQDIDVDIGRSTIGTFASDYAVFSHIDHSSAGNFALAQNGPSGFTLINAAAGQYIRWRIGNVETMALDGTGLGIGTTSPTSTLTVTGATAGGVLNVTQTAAANNAARIIGSHASFTGNVLQPWTVRAAGTAFDLIECVTNNGSEVPFRVRGDGAVTMSGALTTGGIITAPSQPAFLVYPNARLTDVTGDGTPYTAVYNTEVFDQGGDFASSYLFTAPVGGKYQFNVNVNLLGIVSGHTTCTITLATSNRSIRTYFVANVYSQTGAGDQNSFNGSVLTDLDASDTAYVSILVDGGAKVVDFDGDGNYASAFSGYLVA